MIKKTIHQPHYSRSRRILHMLGIVVVAALLANFAYQVWLRYSGANTKPIAARTACDLHNQSCTVLMKNNQNVTLDIAPKSIPLNQPITMTVSLKNIKTQDVKIILTPLKAGKAPVQINLKPKNSHIYTATTTLYKTNIPRQQWMMLVVIKTKDLNIAVPYKFYIN